MSVKDPLVREVSVPVGSPCRPSLRERAFRLTIARSRTLLAIERVDQMWLTGQDLEVLFSLIYKSCPFALQAWILAGLCRSCEESCIKICSKSLTASKVTGFEGHSSRQVLCGPFGGRLWDDLLGLLPRSFVRFLPQARTSSRLVAASSRHVYSKYRGAVQDYF